jgi:hypothetical protein
MTEKHHCMNRGCISRLGNVYRRFWYIGDLLVLGLLSAHIMYVRSYYEVSYRSGLQHNGAPRFARGICIGFWFLFAAVLLLILLFRLTVTWSKRITDRKRRWMLRGLVIALLGLYGGVFRATIRSSGEAFMLGLQEYARANVDVPAIQAWLRTVDPKDCLGDQLRIPIEAMSKAEQARWPEAIKSLKPMEVGLYLDSARRPVVRLIWGGFDEDYGVVVGNVDMEVIGTQPAQAEATYPSAFYEHAHYMRPLAPCAYVYYAF